MQRIDELDLYHLAWEEPAFAANPWPEFEKARARHPWLAKSNAGYVVFELKAIRDLLGHDANLRPSFDGIVEIMDCKGSPWGRFAAEQMIAIINEINTAHPVDHARASALLEAVPRHADVTRSLPVLS